MFLSLSFVDVHSYHTALIFLDHTEVFPAISLIKRCMIRDKIQRIDSCSPHVIAYKSKQFSRDPAAAAVLFHIESAQIRRKVFSLMEIIFDHSCSAYDPAVFHHQIPLWYRDTTLQ